MDEKFLEYVCNTNENVDFILEKATKLDVVSKNGCPIYLLKDPCSKNILKYLVRQAELEQPNLDFDIKEKFLLEVLNDYPAVSTFVSKVTINEDNDEIGHCINDDMLSDDDSSVPLSFTLNDNPPFIMDLQKEILEEVFVGLKREVRADLYAYNKTNVFLDWQMILSSLPKRDRKIIELFDDVFTSGIKSEEGRRAYNAIKEERLNGEGYNQIEALEILTQYLVREQALSYMIEKGTLEGFSYIEPQFMKVRE